jgi:hypothetical protein
MKALVSLVISGFQAMLESNTRMAEVLLEKKVYENIYGICREIPQNLDVNQLIQIRLKMEASASIWKKLGKKVNKAAKQGIKDGGGDAISNMLTSFEKSTEKTKTVDAPTPQPTPPTPPVAKTEPKEEKKEPEVKEVDWEKNPKFKELVEAGLDRREAIKCVKFVHQNAKLVELGEKPVEFEAEFEYSLSRTDKKIVRKVLGIQEEKPVEVGEEKNEPTPITKGGKKDEPRKNL